ncbi:MAG: glycosyl hydrolase family 39 [Ignavibacteriaceae bacterium]
MKKDFLILFCRKYIVSIILSLCLNFPAFSQAQLAINWDNIIAVSKTTPTLQVVVNPKLRSNSLIIHNGSFQALKNLGANYVRLVPWFPYPHFAIAELQPPTKIKTFWDFSQIDPIIKDFMDATQRHSVVINFSTIPDWMFKTDEPVKYPADPNQVFWDYNIGTQLRDTTMKELTDYFVRLLSWYVKGGFTDELGKFHKSGHYYKIPYWEVLNEPDLEHEMSPALYTRIYDAIVTKLKKISPETKFIGMSLAYENNPDWFEYFLNPANHKSGIPLEGISYHFYGIPAIGQTIDSYQYSVFDQAEGFIDKVRYIESIRKRLAPQTFTTIDEIGTILSFDQTAPVPDNYWNLSGAMYAYIYLELAKIGVNVAGESQLVGYPTQFPSVSMINWKNGKPNARYWVLKLLKDNFGPGDKLADTKSNTSDVVAQAFLTEKGKKLLLINKRNKKTQLRLPANANGVKMYSVDVSTGDNPASQVQLTDNIVILRPFSVTVIKLKN